MAGQSKIEWTDATWNPIRGCSRVSEGCRNCYAEGMAARFSKPGQWGHGLATYVTRPDGKREARWTGTMVQAPEATLTAPLRWKAPRRIFVNSTSDLFHEDVPDAWIDRVFAVMALCPQHTFQVLTKRPERMRAYFAAGPWLRWLELMKPLWHGRLASEVAENGALPNVWLGTSVEDQASADARIPHLLETPAAIRFISAEPLLGPVDLTRLGIDSDSEMHALTPIPWAEEVANWGDDPETIEGWLDWYGLSEVPTSGNMHPTLDWVIVGGESGAGARPMHPDWARDLRDQCASADVPFFFKQWGGHTVVYDRDVEDPDWRWCAGIERKTPTGRWLNLAGGHGFHGERVVRVVPTTKKAAGRRLDGVTHDAMPGAAVPRVEAA